MANPPDARVMSLMVWLFIQFFLYTVVALYVVGQPALTAHLFGWRSSLPDRDATARAGYKLREAAPAASARCG